MTKKRDTLFDDIHNAGMRTTGKQYAAISFRDNKVLFVKEGIQTVGTIEQAVSNGIALATTHAGEKKNVRLWGFDIITIMTTRMTLETLRKTNVNLALGTKTIVRLEGFLTHIDRCLGVE